MSDTALLLVVAVILGGLLWYLVKSGTIWVVSGPAPNITILEAFDAFLNMEHGDETRRRIVDLTKRKFSKETLVEMQSELVNIEKHADREDNPLRVIRRAIMGFIDSAALEKACVDLPESDRHAVHAKLKEKGSESSDVTSAGLWILLSARP